jgi:hypothetical protein
MPTVSTPAALPSFIEDLLTDRQSHVDAIAEIDATLSRVSTALGIADVTASIAKPSAVKPMGSTFVKAAAAPAARRRGKVSKFGVSANDFVLDFVRSSKGASTQEINGHWKQAGRAGTADNAMSLLTKLKKLKRTKMTGGQRGSRYTAA